jgi:hypothetical protein
MERQRGLCKGRVFFPELQKQNKRCDLFNILYPVKEVLIFEEYQPWQKRKSINHRIW